MTFSFSAPKLGARQRKAISNLSARQPVGRRRKPCELSIACKCPAMMPRHSIHEEGVTSIKMSSLSVRVRAPLINDRLQPFEA